MAIEALSAYLPLVVILMGIGPFSKYRIE